jgi:hypothetical protein
MLQYSVPECTIFEVLRVGAKLSGLLETAEFSGGDSDSRRASKMGFFDFLLGSDNQHGKKNNNDYEDGLLDGLMQSDWNSEKMKNKKYKEGFLDGLDEPNDDCD